jgi:hypothetical protein
LVCGVFSIEPQIDRKAKIGPAASRLRPNAVGKRS